jgi:hypothetical protein
MEPVIAHELTHCLLAPSPITYWDALGQFVLQTFDEVPLEIVEALIAEAKTTVPVA